MNERYPIGEFECADDISIEEVQSWINEIRLLPARILEVVQGLSDEELAYTYREGGWTIRQIIHHKKEVEITGNAVYVSEFAVEIGDGY